MPPRRDAGKSGAGWHAIRAIAPALTRRVLRISHFGFGLDRGTSPRVILPGMDSFTPIMDREALLAFMREQFPSAIDPDAIPPWDIETIGRGRLTTRLRYAERFLRPGGTISGPTMMTLADTAMYLLILSHVGPVALAVTTSLHIDFLRRPSPGDLLADAELLKLGRKLAVGRVTLREEDAVEPVAHAAVTYALPPAHG
jgi:uncharacterized protein (TIGR00369 family)